MRNETLDTGSRLRRWLMIIGVLASGLLACAAPAAASRADHLSVGCERGHEVALTFDDGPNPPWTEQILAILQSHGARATFFDEGQAIEMHPALPKREIDAGMAVRLHSYGHATTLPAMSAPAFANDLHEGEAVFLRATGFHPALYRAPYGRTSATMLGELGRAGYVSIGWDVDSRDWAKESTADDIVRNVVTAVHPGAIVLMHDGGLGEGNPDRTRTVDALPRIIDALHARGYKLVTIPELTGAPQQQGGARRDVCSAR